MPTHPRKLTDTEVRALPLPTAKREEFHWCPKTPGFGVRVSATGLRAFVLERRVDGKTTRRTLGKATGSGSIGVDTARELRDRISAELAQGKDRATERREAAREARQRAEEDARTFAIALADYCDGKTVKGKPLKPRTRADYLAMVRPPRVAETGREIRAGALHALADTPVARITAADIRAVHKAVLTAANPAKKATSARALPRGQRQATYAMQVLRAVLRAEGVKVPESPLSTDTPLAKRIQLHTTKGAPTAIPPGVLPSWWASATAEGDTGHIGADGLRLMLLTGCRPGEVFGNAHSPGIRRGDVDLTAGTITLRDTKARNDHTIFLSRQALEIVRKRVQATKKAEDRLYAVVDVRKVLARINAAAIAAAGTDAGTLDKITPHKLRHTFGTVASRLVSAYVLKRLMNHAVSDDVTAGHYVGVNEADLREGWQKVADSICGPGNPPPAGTA